jgi:hypothetical protein
VQDPPAGPGVPYGREFDGAAINALLLNCMRAGSVDEDLLYAMAGVADFRSAGHKSVTWRAAHGTHVMDLACGYDMQENRVDRPIVCVQLPRALVANTQEIRNSNAPLDAMRYILRCADIIAARQGRLYVPVVINFSFGAGAGPHDGTSHFEQQVDELVDARKAMFGPLALEVVLPSGNAHLSRCHAEVALVSFQNAGGVVPLMWRVLPDDRTPSFLEIWLPYRGAAVPPNRLRLRITPPGGPTSAWIGENGAPIEWPPGNPVYRANFRFDPPPLDRGAFTVVISPTASLDPNERLAPAGTWRIDLENLGLAPNDVVHAWIERDETVYGYPLRARQSYFDHECYKRFDVDGAGREIEEDQPGCVVKRAGTLSAIATGRNPVVLGGLLRKEMRAVKYSAGGPITTPQGAPPDPFRPDAVTVSDDSSVHRGVLAAGSRSGSVVAMVGTSVAAPQITRWIADRLAQGMPADRQIVQNLAWWQELAAAASILPPRPPLTPPPPNNPRYGAGRIELPSPPPLGPQRSILDTRVPRPRFVER